MGRSDGLDGGPACCDQAGWMWGEGVEKKMNVQVGDGSGGEDGPAGGVTGKWLAITGGEGGGSAGEMEELVWWQTRWESGD